MATALPGVITTRIPTSITLNQGYYNPDSAVYSITGSSDGQKLYNSGYLNPIAFGTSSDGGKSWIFSAPSSVTGTMYQIACSSDGTLVLGGVYSGGQIVLSTNSGISFSVPTGSVAGNWIGAAMSSTGQYMYCSAEGGGLYRSTNTGASFSGTTISGAGAPSGLACNTTGQYVYLANRTPASVFYSSDYGVTWNSYTFSVGSAAARCITCSSSGQYVYVGFYSGTSTSLNIYASSNYGVSWSALTSYTASNGFTYGSIKCSSNGAVVFATEYYAGGIVSFNFGSTWTAVTPALGTSRAYVSPNGTKFVSFSGNSVYINDTVPTQYVPSTITDLSSLSYNTGSATFNGALLTYGAIANLKDGIITSAWFPTNSGTFTGNISFTFGSSITITRIRVWTIYNNTDKTPSAITITPSGSGSIFTVSGLTSSSYSTTNNVEAYYDCTFSSTSFTTVVIQLTSCSSGARQLFVNEVQFFSS